MKRIISLFLCITLLISVISVSAINVNAEITVNDDIQIGDTITLGKYLNEPIVWRCVDIDENGPLMLSEKILCLKAFDAAGDDSVYHSDGWGYVRKRSGSNCWSDSNLRQWLNSSEDQVQWSHCPPSKEMVSGGYNPYDSEAGFLNGFTKQEIELIKTVTQKSYINSWESTRAGYHDGGSYALIYNISDKDVDYSAYMYQNVTDKVFLLNPEQTDAVYRYSKDFYKNAKPTASAVENSNYQNENLSVDKPFWYWLGIPRNEGASYENQTTSNTALNNNISCAGACWGNVGVRPAFYLNFDKFQENNTLTKNIKQQIENIDFGPYALKGATINVAGYEIPLVDIEAKLSLSIGENIKIISNTNGTIKVLIGFDQDASANLSGEKNSSNYWSESYREVKSMYQDLTGKKVDTTRLWNKFSSLRGKLRKNNASMIVDVDSSITGYAEFSVTGDGIKFSEGGVVAQFEANTSIRTYPYPFVYMALGLGVNAKGELIFTNEDGKINPSITVSPSFKISAGGGIGTKSTYAQIDAYGTLSANIATSSEVPFEAGVDIGVRWMGYILGKEIFSGSKSFASMELYPNLGDTWPAMLMCTEPDIDIGNTASYKNLLNSSTPIGRNYLASSYSLRSNQSTDGTDFLKRNVYPLSSPNLVKFNDDTMLLIWIDDTGNKTIENRCSLMYSYFDGIEWSTPTTVYEDGMNADMPSVYSDGTYAYIVWQKATCVFDETVETSEMLNYYDLYATVFDSSTQTFGEIININSDNGAVFEFSPVIYGADGKYEIAWIENSDNNVYQMSGENSIYTVSVDIEGNTSDIKKIVDTNGVFKGIDICSGNVVYSLYEAETNNLYLYDGSIKPIAEKINCFDCENGKIFYSDGTGLYSYDGNIVSYPDMGSVDEFTVSFCSGNYALFTKVLNEDFSKSLYYATMSEGDTVWTNMELYCGIGTYIRDYSPVILSDGTVHVAFNHVTFDPETDDETAMLQIGQCTNDVNISLEYVDFDDHQLSGDSIDLLMNVSNHSSKKINSLDVVIEDNNGNIVYSKTIELTIDAFSNTDFSVNYTIPDEYNGEVYTVKVMPTDYNDYQEYDNEVSTTFQCVHINSGDWIIDKYPSNEDDGILVQKCLVCNKILEEKELPRLKFQGASLTLQDNLAINYKVNANLFTEVGYTNPYVVFVLGDRMVKVDDYSLSEDGQSYIFTFDNITPDQMNDNISATLYAVFNGVGYTSQVKRYSAAQYCYNLLGKYSGEENTKLRTLLVDLLNYGSASQLYTDHNIEALANERLTEDQINWGTGESPELKTVKNTEYKTIENPAVTWKGAGLNLQKSVTMRFKIAADSIDSLSVKIESESGGEWTIPAESFVKTDDGYYIYFNGLNAGQMSEPVYVTVYNGSTAVSNTICYSIESYAYSKQNSGDTLLNSLLIAMMKYGNSAYSYVN